MSQHETTRQESVTENNQKPADTSSQNGRPTKSASAVGTKFVLKYYTILSTSPHSVHNFYAENSTFTFGEYSFGGRTIEESVKGQEQIRKKIQQLDFQDCKVTLDVVNCQDSLQDSVFILVIGYVHKEQVQPRKFTQCFVLAAQSESETSKRYHIVNDMFHYLEETSSSSSAPAASVSNSTPSAPPTNTSSLPTPTSRSESTPNGDSASAPNKHIQSSKKDEATAKAPPVQTEHPSDLNNQVSHAPSAPTTPSAPQQAAAPSTASTPSTPSTPSAPSTPSVPPSTAAAPSSSTAPAEKNNNSAHAESKKHAKREKANKEANNTNNANNTAAAKQSNARVTASSEAQPAAEKVDKAAQSWAQIAKSKSAPSAAAPSATPATTSTVAVTTSTAAVTTSTAAPQQQQVQSTQPQQLQNEQKLSKSASSSPYESREVRDGYSVYVSNLPFNATDESVRGLFSPFGEIKSVVILKGYCFVEFVSPESVKHIVQSSKETPLVLDGRALSIDWKKGKSGTPKNQEKSNSFNRAHPRNKDMKRSGTSPAVNGKLNKQHEHNEKKAALSKDG